MATDSNPALRIGTLAVHAGPGPEASSGALTTPIFQTSTYEQPAPGAPHQGRYDYSRGANPTREALESAVALLEGGHGALAFASGMAALEAVVKQLSAGDHVVCEENVYGGTVRMFDEVIARFGISFTYVDTRDPDAIAAAMRPETRLVHLETPTNPLLHVTDIRAAVEIAHAHGALVSVDNTFASPFNQRPISLGADLVVHSSTKYLNGHSDVIGGIVVTGTAELTRAIRRIRSATGAVPGPMDAWLTLRGVRTLAVRMRQHNTNGAGVAHFLDDHPSVLRVSYPGLPSHPAHALARRQMSGFSGMVSIDLGSAERARDFATRLRLFALAESLGGVESLVGVPWLMSHSSISEDRRRALGIGPGLVRLSVGIEDVEDLIEDLAQALGPRKQR